VHLRSWSSGLAHAFLPTTLAGPDLLPALHLMAASSMVMLVGLLDDVRGARPATKIAIQVAAAVYLYVNGFQIGMISNPLLGKPFVLGWISLPLTIAWFVGISNAFNLIDGLDGLAAGVGLFSTSIVFVFSILNSRRSRCWRPRWRRAPRLPALQLSPASIFSAIAAPSPSASCGRAVHAAP
jgi:UDP-N-acetylmuramyl pentapeptide phosphotransferase/UDP-N-acetylglucosamine-1-phosphate transferase